MLVFIGFTPVIEDTAISDGIAEMDGTGAVMDIGDAAIARGIGMDGVVGAMAAMVFIAHADPVMEMLTVHVAVLVMGV